MIQGVEHLGSELQLEPFGDLERLNETKVDIPVIWRDKDITPCSVLSGRRNRKRTGIFEENRSYNARFVLQLRSYRRQHDSAGDVSTVGCSAPRRGRTITTAIDTKWLARHERVNRIHGPAAENLIYNSIG